MADRTPAETARLDQEAADLCRTVDSIVNAAAHWVECPDPDHQALFVEDVLLPLAHADADASLSVIAEIVRRLGLQALAYRRLTDSLARAFAEREET